MLRLLFISILSALVIERAVFFVHWAWFKTTGTMHQIEEIFYSELIADSCEHVLDPQGVINEMPYHAAKLCECPGPYETDSFRVHSKLNTQGDKVYLCGKNWYPKEVIVPHEHL